MAFRDREKTRLTATGLVACLFGQDADGGGDYAGSARAFCLPVDVSSRNLHQSLRADALSYFESRAIHWHDGVENGRRPSNHMCCSQSACVNAWFAFRQDRDALRHILVDLGYPVQEVLPFAPDVAGRDHERDFVAFEWVGLRNYLKERTRGQVAPDDGRSRGQGFTSADFAFRFLRDDGRTQIVLGEWKYTEEYVSKGNMQFSNSKSKTDRLGIYAEYLRAADSPIRLGSVGAEALFFDPFDQLMRLQLLAHQMELAHELNADIVSVLHIAPRANRELAKVTSPSLAAFGADPHAIWSRVVGDDHFLGCDFEDLLPVLCRAAPLPAWADWMTLRYGGMS